MLLVTGASGFLGTNVLRAAALQTRDVVAASNKRHTLIATAGLVHADLTDKAVVREMVSQTRPEWVLNCAALANLEECEKDPASARLLNVTAAANLAEACAEFGARFAHISTDSVFDGSRGNYSEDDVPSPLNVYAMTKLEGERAVRELLPKALVVRTNFIGLPVIPGTGLADWIATSIEAGKPIKGFDDVIFSPLLATTLADRLFDMMDARLTGLYHLGASDSISKYGLAVAIAAEMGHADAKIERVSLSNAPMAVHRPLNTSLVSKRAETALKTKMPAVIEAVKGFVAQRQELTQSNVTG